MMWKKSFLTLLIISQFGWAKTTTPAQKMWTETEVAALRQQWETEQKNHNAELQAQRSNFLQLETLLKSAERTGTLSAATLKLAEQLRASLTHYPLTEEADWAVMKAKLKAKQVTLAALAQFIERYPQLAKRNKLDQLPFNWLYQQQKFTDLVEYGKNTPATGIVAQCQLFAAQYQLLAEKEQINPELAQSQTSPDSAEMAQLLADFDLFWLGKMNGLEANYWKANGTLPNECSNIESYWRDRGFQTTDKIKQKAVDLFNVGSTKGLETLRLNSQNPDLINWLEAVQKLLTSPQNLQNFAENQPLDAPNKAIMLAAFPKFIRTLSEQTANPTFLPYQNWAEKWQLTANEQQEWRKLFISRLFDNEDPSFQLWRDEQLKMLKEDSLTERRLRTAIFQQNDITSWLALLSSEAQAKLEWRYWQAKAETNKEKQRQQWQSLSQERGFYAMLAAQMLNKPYQFAFPTAPSLTEAQRQKFAVALSRIQELRELKRFNAARIAWIELLQAVDFNEKLALSEFALQQNWFDLSVEGTIQAKAWDYLPLRLPNAYADWFAINLTDKSITQTFAMAIARQESAWNFQAASHANAIGLMQMLGSTAKQTATTAQLPYNNENDLYDPFSNIMLGTAHLAELNAKYPNNRILIAAAYNAGAQRVERWLARANQRLAMDEFIATIPFLETRGYVQNVLTYDYYYQLLQKEKQPIMFYTEEFDRKY